MVITIAAESAALLAPKSSSQDKIPPQDSFHLAYIIYFTLGAGYLLPWNAFITTVDYFTYLYPGESIDRVFTVVYITVGLTSLLLSIAFAHKSNPVALINLGYALFLVSLVAVPLIDVWYVKGRVGIYGAYYLTVGVVALCGIPDGLVQGGVLGNAGQLPERYMQAVVAGTAASGVIVSALRVFTKAVYPSDATGLTRSANLYFIVSIAMMLLNIILYNIAHKLPVIRYYNDLKSQAIDEEKEHKGNITGKQWRSTLCEIVGAVKWYGSGTWILCVVTLSIFPGSLTEDVHSDTLKDWYPIILIAAYNVFDLVGKCLTSVYVVENANVAIGASFGRVVFLPIFYVCLHGPYFFRTEIPVTILTCVLGLTNGYFTSVLMMLAPKTVQIQHQQSAGIVMALYLVVGVASGCIASWLWLL